MVMVSVEIPFTLTVGGKKALLTESPPTVKLAVMLLVIFRFCESEIFAGETVLV